MQLSRSRSVAEIASLIWSGRFDGAFSPAPPTHRHAYRPDKTLPFVPRAQAVLASASVRDHAAFDLRATSVAHAGWRILHLLTRVARLSRTSGPTIDQALAHAWGVNARGVDVVRSALILCADHELNVSSFTARCVASAASNPYTVVIAGLAALEGTRHGGASARVESMLESLERSRHPGTAVAARLRRGESIDGFGHPLYRDGDPRAIALLDALRERYPKSRELSFVLDCHRRRDGHHARASESRLRSRVGGSRAEAACRIAADALRHRQDHRLDRSGDRAVRDGTAHSSAGQIRWRRPRRDYVNSQRLTSSSQIVCIL